LIKIYFFSSKYCNDISKYLELSQKNIFNTHRKKNYQMKNVFLSFYRNIFLSQYRNIVSKNVLCVTALNQSFLKRCCDILKKVRDGLVYAWIDQDIKYIILFFIKRLFYENTCVYLHFFSLKSFLSAWSR